jgi:CHAD domain-containing protein
MRVATRRFRAFLRAARPLLEREWADSLRAELGWLGGALGPVRDIDVLGEYLREDEEGLDPRTRRAARRLFAELDRERDEARSSMLEALESPRYFTLLDRLEEAAQAPRLAEGEGLSLGSLARAEFRKLRKAVDSLDRDPSDDALHAIRIRGKRARYAAELAAPTLGKRGAAFIERAKVLQDVLGAHQDSVFAEERIRALLDRAGGKATAFAAGQLTERERTRRLEARAAFPKAWTRLEKAGRALWK